jgi:hypothetical protein
MSTPALESGGVLDSKGVVESELEAVVESEVEDESVLPVDPIKGIWSANAT